MSWERRSRDDEPVAEQRTITDDDGRRWTGTVSSGRFPGGEENAEVIWVCDDQPSELKRVADLGIPPGRADKVWLSMNDDEVSAVFLDSRPAS